MKEVILYPLIYFNGSCSIKGEYKNVIQSNITSEKLKELSKKGYSIRIEISDLSLSPEEFKETPQQKLEKLVNEEYRKFFEKDMKSPGTVVDKIKKLMEGID